MKLIRAACLTLAPLVLAAAVVVASAPAGASSHREAPLISKDPSVDNTDVYAFVSPDATNTVTLIANWIPFEEPGGGPNFYHFDDNALYNIKIDTDGDAIPDVTYEWQFDSEFVAPTDSFLYNNGQIVPGDVSKQLYRQYYTVTRFNGDNTNAAGVRSTTGTELFARKLMVPDNIGPRSTPNYATLAASYVQSAAGYKEFTGQREDPFYVDVNSIFDLGGLRPFNALHLIPLVPTVGLDSTKGYNVHATAIQVPINDVAPACPANDPGLGGSKNCVIGVWSSADRPQITTLVGLTSLTNPGGETTSGNYVQVSRLGMPLTNEVVLPIGLKDAFNALKPELDKELFTGAAPFNPALGAIVQRSVLRPELQALYKVLYPTAFTDANLPAGDRTDLFTIFFTGIPNVNEQAKSMTEPSEQLRLNVAFKPTTPACTGNRLGALAGEFTGFPNGRRLEDDVTDISLRAVAGGYGDILGGPAPGGAGALKLPNFSPGNLLSDGVDKNDVACLSTFPYVGTPHSGYDRSHGSVTINALPTIVVNSSFQPKSERGR